MELKGKKVIILVEDMYNDLEFWYPYFRLKEAGVEVTVVGPVTGKVYTGKAGLQIKSDIEAKQVLSADFNGLIIPGGYAPDRMRRHTEMVKLVQDFARSGKVVAAICHAGWMLASAKVLQRRTVTSFFAIKDDLIHAGANYLDQEVVVDDNLITSRTPDDLPAFTKAVIAALSK